MRLLSRRRRKAGFQELAPDQDQDPDRAKTPGQSEWQDSDSLLAIGGRKSCLDWRAAEQQEEVSSTKTCLRLPQCRPVKRKGTSPSNKQELTADQDLRLHFETGLNILSVDSEELTAPHQQRHPQNQQQYQQQDESTVESHFILEDLSIAISASANTTGSQTGYETKLRRHKKEGRSIRSDRSRSRNGGNDTRKYQNMHLNNDGSHRSISSMDEKCRPYRTRQYGESPQDVLPSSFEAETHVTESKRMKQLETLQHQGENPAIEPSLGNIQPDMDLTRGGRSNPKAALAEANDAAMFAFYHQQELLRKEKSDFYDRSDDKDEYGVDPKEHRLQTASDQSETCLSEAPISLNSVVQQTDDTALLLSESSLSQRYPTTGTFDSDHQSHDFHYSKSSSGELLYAHEDQREHHLGLERISEHETDIHSTNTSKSSSQEEEQRHKSSACSEDLLQRPRYAMPTEYLGAPDPELQEETTSYASLSSTPDHNEPAFVAAAVELATAIPISLLALSTNPLKKMEANTSNDDQPHKPVKNAATFAPATNHRASTHTKTAAAVTTKPTAQSRSVFARYREAKEKPVPQTIGNHAHDESSKEQQIREYKQEGPESQRPAVIRTASSRSQKSLLSEINAQDFPGLSPETDPLVSRITPQDMPGLKETDSSVINQQNEYHSFQQKHTQGNDSGIASDHNIDPQYEEPKHQVVWQNPALREQENKMILFKSPTTSADGATDTCKEPQAVDNSDEEETTLSTEQNEESWTPDTRLSTAKLTQKSLEKRSATPLSLRHVESDCDSATPTVLRDNTKQFDAQNAKQLRSLSTIRDESLLDQDSDSATSGANQVDSTKSDIFSFPAQGRSKIDQGDMYSLPLPEPVMMPVSLSPRRKQNTSSWRFAPEYQDSMSLSPTRGQPVTSPQPLATEESSNTCDSKNIPDSQSQTPTTPTSHSTSSPQPVSAIDSKKITPSPPFAVDSSFDNQLRQRMSAINSGTENIFPATYPTKEKSADNKDTDLVQWPSGESPEPIMYAGSNSEILEDDEPTESGIEIYYKVAKEEPRIASNESTSPYQQQKGQVQIKQKKLATFLLFDDTDDASMFGRPETTLRRTDRDSSSMPTNNLTSYQSQSYTNKINIDATSKKQLSNHLVTPPTARVRKGTNSPTNSMLSGGSTASSRVQLYWKQQITDHSETDAHQTVSVATTSSPVSQPNSFVRPKRSPLSHQPRVSARIQALQKQFASA